MIKLNRNSLILISAVLGLTVVATAQKPNGNDFMDYFQKQVGPKIFSFRNLPQNFGGEAEKLKLNQSVQIQKKSIELALSDEAYFQIAQGASFVKLEKLFLTKQAKEATSLFSSQVESNLGQASIKKIRSIDSIEEMKWSLPKTTQPVSTAMQNYLNQFTQIVDVDFYAVSAATPLNERDPKTYAPRLFNSRLEIDVRGKNKKGEFRQDRLLVEATVEKINNTWKISKWNVSEGETLLSTSRSFEKSDVFADKKPEVYLRREAIRRGGYALAVCDYNNDGYQDILVGHLAAVEVFSGTKEGRFKPVDLAKLGIKPETLVKSISCNDFDNDGKKDLMFVRFAPNEEKGKDIVLYQNAGSTFNQKTIIHNRLPAYYAMPSAVADFNQDGYLDFYIGFPGAKDFTVLNKSANGFKGEKAAHPQGLFFNSKNFEFTEVSQQKIPYSKNKNPYTDGYPEVGVVFPHTSAGVDYNLDGLVDIVVVDDKANLSPLYQNKGDGQFVQVAEKIGVTNFDFGMGFTAADLNNDGTLEFIYTNVNFLAAERLKNILRENYSSYDSFPGIQAIRIFQSRDAKNYSDVTAVSGIKNTGYGVGGVEVIDYNNDGYLDFYVPAGLWSGTEKHNDIGSLFMRSFMKSDLDYQETVGSVQGVENANTSFMKILTDFSGDTLTQERQLGRRPSMEGFQRNRLFRNNKDGTFTEVAYLEGVDSLSDGYIVGTADFNADGKMDLILRNADPGTEQNKFDAVEIYTNISKNKNKSVTLALEGRRSNRDAIGAILIAHVGRQKMTRLMLANNGAIQSQALVHFGLGHAKKIDQLEVRWPSGQTEIFKNITPGQHKLTEGVDGRLITNL